MNDLDYSGLARLGSSPMDSERRPPRPKLWLQTLCLLFGFGSWIAITGLWVELPLLVDRLPEGWSLGANLTVVIQAANLGPLIYWIARRRNWCTEVTANHLQFFLGAVGCLLLVFLWDRTVAITETISISLVLYICAFLLSLVDCTSSTSFLPFMGRFENHYMTPYLVGEGLSGFIPSVVALFQGVGGVEELCESSSPSLNVSLATGNNDTITKVIARNVEPKFPIWVFFASLELTLLISWLAFVILWLLPACKRHQIKRRKWSIHPAVIGSGTGTGGANVAANGKLEMELEEEDRDFLGKRRGHLNWRDGKYQHAILILVWSCFLTFGIMPSIQTYSAKPYGDWTLHYSVIANNVAFPVGCLVAMFLEIRTRHLINIIILIGSLVATYIGQCALLSPYPPLVDDQPFTGGVIMITAWFLFTFLMSYGKTMVTLDMKDLDADEGLFWVGMATQFGSFVGALLMFFVVHYTDLFTGRECQIGTGGI